MSDLVEIEDLNLLDGGDLRAVFSQVEEPRIVEALVGLSAGLRNQLLTKLPSAMAGRLQVRLGEYEPTSLESIRAAQRDVVEALCRLSRGGMVAFDDPADMMVA